MSVARGVVYARSTGRIVLRSRNSDKGLRRRQSIFGNAPEWIWKRPAGSSSPDRTTCLSPSNSRTMLIQTRSTRDNCRYVSTYAHRQSSKVRAFPTPRAHRKPKGISLVTVLSSYKRRAELGFVLAIQTLDSSEAVKLAADGQSFERHRPLEDLSLLYSRSSKAPTKVFGNAEAFGGHRAAGEADSLSPIVGLPDTACIATLTSRNAVSSAVCAFRHGLKHIETIKDTNHLARALTSIAAASGHMWQHP
ncbi:hypothetical protein MRX96_040779 [Rhipicephalus microplus]